MPQVNRYCTVSLLHQAKAVAYAALKDDPDVEESDLPLPSSLQSAAGPSPGLSVAQGSSQLQPSPQEPAHKRRAVQQQDAAPRPQALPSAAAAASSGYDQTPSETGPAAAPQTPAGQAPFQLSGPAMDHARNLMLPADRLSGGPQPAPVVAELPGSSLQLQAPVALAVDRARPTVQVPVHSTPPERLGGLGSAPAAVQSSLGAQLQSSAMRQRLIVPASDQQGSGVLSEASGAAQFLHRHDHRARQTVKPSMQLGRLVAQDPLGLPASAVSASSQLPAHMVQPQSASSSLWDIRQAAAAATDAAPALTDPNFAPLLEELLSWQ